jgi:hypothetical protein
MIRATCVRSAACLAICALTFCVLAATIAASDGARAAMPRIRLSVHPATAEGNTVTHFRFVARRGAGARARPVRAATVSFAGVRARTGSRGRAVIVRRLRPGNYRARGCKTSFACGSARVVALAHGAAR